MTTELDDKEQEGIPLKTGDGITSTSETPPQIDPELIKAIKLQILDEMKDDEVRQAEELKIERERQQEAHKEFVGKMKLSSDPWVEIIGWGYDPTKGIKIELEWNEAFIIQLRTSGITGTDDDQVVQKWITLLLRDMADQIEETREITQDSEFSG